MNSPELLLMVVLLVVYCAYRGAATTSGLATQNGFRAASDRGIEVQSPGGLVTEKAQFEHARGAIQTAR